MTQTTCSLPHKSLNSAFVDVSLLLWMSTSAVVRSCSFGALVFLSLHTAIKGVDSDLRSHKCNERHMLYYQGSLT